MKKPLIIILTLLYHVSTFSQTDDCKYDKNETDKFTNKKIIWTKWDHLSPLISREYAPDVRCIVEDSVKQLLIYVNGYTYTYDKPTQASLDSYLVVPSGSKVIFLMEDGKPFELTTAKETHSTGEYKPPYTGDNNSAKFRINWQVTLTYKLDGTALKTLGAQGVTSLRLFYKPENYRDYIVGKKKYSVLQNLVNCIK